jgi:hypothetical protein
MGKITNDPQVPVSARPKREFSAATAQETAILALGFLAADPERLERFLALTGLSPPDVPDLLRNGVLHLATLDHIAADEPLLLAFAAAHDLPPETVALARRALAGPAGRMDDWS